MSHSPEAVANEFLDRSKARGIALTPMHLQKLVYIAHGWTLALTGRPLVNVQPEAWQYGPVYSSLYDSLKRYGSGEVVGPIVQNNWASSESVRGSAVKEKFTESETLILNRVSDQYAALEAFQLSALTHSDGSPWTERYKPGLNRIIPNDRIERYFKNIANRRPS